MNVVDTSVVIPGLSPWHEHHAASKRALDGARLASHALLESYSSLTRLPEPFRVAPSVASEILTRRFASSLVYPDPESIASLPRRLAIAGIMGGATYDALIAQTAADNDATLITLDDRAARTYAAMGVRTHKPI